MRSETNIFSTFNLYDYSILRGLFHQQANTAPKIRRRFKLIPRNLTKKLLLFVTFLSRQIVTFGNFKIKLFYPEIIV